MATTYEYALFSLEVYNDTNDNDLLPGTVDRIPAGWSLLLESPAELNGNGYFGAAYINNSTNEVVIAHRGTSSGFEILFDLGDDLSLAIDLATEQFFDSAVPFIEQVKLEFLNQTGFAPQITYTGHSLGAFIAEMSSARDLVPATTFDSPGSLPNIQALTNDGTFSSGAVSYVNNNVTTYNSAPNLVNTTNDHVGDLYRVYPNFPVPDLFPQPGSIYYATSYSLFGQHSMRGIFQQFDSLTGNAEIVSKPADWPSGIFIPGYEHYSSYDHNPHYWEIYFAANGITGQARLDFINAELGGVHDNGEPGVVITGDGSANYIWGTTNSQDTVHGNGGNDTILGYGGNDFLFGEDGNDTLDGGTGTDTYAFTLSGFGQDEIIDDDGVIKFGDKVLSGIAVEADNAPGLYTLRMQGDTNVYVLVQQENDLRIAVNSITATPADSVLIKDYFVDNADGLAGRYGIVIEKVRGIFEEFPVNTINVLGSQINSEVTALTNGHFFVTWQSWHPDFNYAFYGKMFDLNGIALGDEFLISAFNSRYASYGTRTAPLDNGNSIVMWTEDSGRKGQIFSSTGDAMGNRINTVGSYHALTALNDGGFAVSYAGAYNKLYFQKFHPDGTTNGAAIPYFMSVFNSSALFSNIIELNKDNSILVVYLLSHDNVMDMRGQKFNEAGAAIGQEFVIATSVSNYSDAPISVTELKNGNLVATWTHASPTGSATPIDVYGQILASNGEKIGNVFLVNTATNLRQNEPSVAVLGNGDFVVIWHDDSGGSHIVGQKFSSNGEKIGADFTITSPGHGGGGMPDMTSLGDDRIIFTWNYSNGDTSGNGVYARILDFSSSSVGTSGHDVVFGTLGSDVLFGFEGNDILDGHGGTDILQGGTGADSFIISPDAGIETTITDFEVDVIGELIDLSAFDGIYSFDDLLITEGSAIVHLPDGQTIHITNLTPGDLSADDFLFATPPNTAPTAVVLDNAAVDENMAGAVIGNLTVEDADVGDTHVLSVDDARFEIVAGQLKLAVSESLDFETAPVHNIAVTVTDQGGLTHVENFSISVNNVNEAPTALDVAANTDEDNDFVISLSDLLIQSNATDVDGDNVSVTAVVNAVGGSVVLDQQAQKVVFTPAANYNGPASFGFTVSDGNGGEVTRMVNLTVAAVNDVPVVSNIMINQNALEDAVFSFTVPAGTFDDADGDALTLAATLADGSALPDWIGFDGVTFSGTPTNADVGTISVKVTATDPLGVSVSTPFDLVVANTNDAPMAVVLDNAAVDENIAGAVIGNLTVEDADAGDTHVLSVDDARFELVGGQLKLKAGESLDFETAPNVTVQVTATDSGGLSVVQELVVSVGDVNEAPYSVALDNVAVDENAAVGTVIGHLSTVDEDENETHSYSLNAASLGLFAIVGNELRVAGGLDFETVAAHDIAVTVTDNGGLTHVENFTVAVNNINEAPVLALPLVDAQGEAGQGFAYTIPPASFSDVDGDALTLAVTLADGSPLPAWLQFDGTSLHGTPETAGAFALKVTASDGQLDVSDVFDVTIDAAPPSEPLPPTGAGVIEGNAYNNILNGTNNVDIISGLGGDDLLSGKRGDDQLFGGEGNDILLGGKGDDALYGGAGGDVLYGDAGADLLAGGAGADLLFGGDGNDSFVFYQFSDSSANAKDVIADFHAGDYLDFSHLGIDGIDDITVQQNGSASTTIAANGHDFTVELLGVHTLHEADFVFG